jgi:hypothetical protein
LISIYSALLCPRTGRHYPSKMLYEPKKPKGGCIRGDMKFRDQ